MITDGLVGCLHPVWLAISAAEFAVMLLFMRCLPWRSDDVRAIAVESAAAFALWYGVHLLHLDFLCVFSLNVAVLMAYGVVSRSITARQALYAACTFVLCTEVGKVVCVDLVMQPLSVPLAALPGLAITLIWGAVSLLVTLAAALAVRRWAFVPGTERLSWHQCLFLLLPLVPYLFIRSSYFYDSVSENQTLYWDYVWMMLALSACTIVMIVANASSLSAQLERNELIRLQMLLNEQSAQYLAQKKANEAVRRRCHDLKHYLVEFERVLGDGGMGEQARGDAARLLADMREELVACGTRIETGNEVLDVVLSEKMAASLRVGVRPLFYADAKCLSFMSAFDLCAIFGNLLDNAVDAAAACVGDSASESSGTPEITLDIRPEKGFVAIRCCNPYTGELRPVADTFASTKPGEGHGIGLRSVRTTVERYGGVLTVDAADGTFTAVAVIPQPAPGMQTSGACGDPCC